MELETALAAVSWDRVTNRDAEKTYTLMTSAALREHAAGFDWDPWLDALGAPDGAFDEVVVRQPELPVRGGRAVGRAPAGRSGRRGWRSARPRPAPDYLTEAVVAEDFAFYGRTLSGTPQLRERWKRGVSLVEGALGEAVGAALRRAALPRVGEGADGHARREPGGGLPAEHRRRWTG